MKRIDVKGRTRDTFHNLSCCYWPSWIDGHTPVICVHGLLRNGRDFDKLAAELSQTRPVYCPDLPGRGFSEDLPSADDYLFDQYFSDLTVIMAAMGGGPVDWVGTSLGGMLGMHIAAMDGNPIRKLVINDVGPLVKGGLSQSLCDTFDRIPETFESEQEIEKFLRHNYAGWGALTDDDWAVMACHSKRVRADGKLTIGYDRAIEKIFYTPMDDINLWETYDRIKCPVLLLRGKSSGVLSEEVAQEMTRRGPRAKLVEIEGCAHAPSLMTPEQIRLVADFIKG